MHPAVISFWLIPHDPPEEHAAGWAEQRATIFQSAVEGHWWGTITSEPGSGGDIARTRTIAQQDGGPLNYRISGQKHFGSGSGVTSFMMTTAIPEDYGKPDLFYLDVREATWDGATGMKLTAPWDGHGMIATQSHGFMFENFPATRIAWPGVLDPAAAVAGGGACLFSAVILGIVDSAMLQGTADVQRRSGAMNAYEQMEWTRALSEAWLCDQAFEGMLRAIEESPTGTSVEALHGKAMIAELAETLLGRLCKIAGGGSFGRHSPYGFWFEDVRALGFLRPPWGLMYGAMVDAALAPEE
jgi:alkylation response protein AidB-like acyl-CoA dehydrogenase